MGKKRTIMTKYAWFLSSKPHCLAFCCSELLRGREVTIQEIRQEKKIEERQRKFDEERMRLPKLEGYDYDLM